MSSLNSRQGWGYGDSSNFNSQRTGSEGMASTRTTGGAPGGNNRRLKKTPPSVSCIVVRSVSFPTNTKPLLSQANRFVRVALQRPQEVFVNVSVESYELRDDDVIAGRTRTDTNDLEFGRTNGLKAASTEDGASDWV
ncbi:hypothetical protein PQX77_011849 [Marasmius sp. AFHP31]|nr:hypothetical protein PQX77_011849 [Marasmius sp. AFHP31]